MTRPHVLTVAVDRVPLALRNESRWCAWRYEWRDGRWTKIPCTPAGRHARVNDPTTWCTFDAAVTAYRTGRFDGIGFCLGDGWAGVDLDHCRRDDAYRPAAEALIRLLDCYVEVSPSGTGAKAFFRADRVGGQVDFADGVVVTPWHAGRFFAVTGHGSGDPSVDRTSVLRDVLPAPAPPPSRRRGYEAAADMSDDDLLLQAVGADNGDAFLRLWRGDTSDYGGDHSRADQALCCHLAFWTNGDEARIDRLFRLSGLMREKWNAPSYRRATLRKALWA